MIQCYKSVTVYYFLSLVLRFRLFSNHLCAVAIKAGAGAVAVDASSGAVDRKTDSSAMPTPLVMMLLVPIQDFIFII